MRNSYQWLIRYFLVVLAFSLVYWLLWFVKPDSFIVNQQLNVQPFQSVNEFLWIEHSPYRTGSHVDLEKYKQKYDNYYDQILNAEKEIGSLTNKMSELEERLDNLHEIRNKEIDVNFKNYNEAQLKPYVDVEEKLQSELELLEKKLPGTVETESDLDIIKKVGSKRVELAKARVDTARKAAQNADLQVTNVAAFISDKTWNEFQNLLDKRRGLYEQRYSYEREIGDIRVAAIDAVREDIKQVRERVRWSDFAFFSIGISTTTTFGDLVANDNAAKVLISIQLLICIVIVAGFVNSVGRKQS